MDRNKQARTKLREKSKEVKEAELSDFISKQKQYRRLFMETMYKKNEVEELQLQINSGVIKVQWHGMDMPEKIAKSFFNLLVYNYREYAKELEGMKQQLKKLGMTDKELVKLIEDDKYKGEINESVK